MKLARALPALAFLSGTFLLFASRVAVGSQPAAQPATRPTTGAATQPAPEPAEAARLLDEHFTERARNGFSGVILLVVDGKTLLEKPYGFRDPIAQAPMDTGDIFDIGSLVKPLTRAAILKLEAQGKLSTADRIVKYFPDLPADKHAITIDHVIRHRAGFPDTFGGDYELIDRAELRRRLFEAELIAPIGADFHYSNAGYSLLAMLIEDLGSRPYEEWVHDELLAPAGQRQVGYRIPYWRSDTLAVGVRRNGQRFGTPLDQAWYGDGPGWNLRGNGGMLANARAIHDLFLALENDDRVLPAAARAKWGPAARPDGRILSASAGGNGIFNSLIVRSITPASGGRPARDMTFVGLSNVGGQEVESSEAVLRQAFGARQ